MRFGFSKHPIRGIHSDRRSDRIRRRFTLALLGKELDRELFLEAAVIPESATTFEPVDREKLQYTVENYTRAVESGMQAIKDASPYDGRHPIRQHAAGIHPGTRGLLEAARRRFWRAGHLSDGPRADESAAWCVSALRAIIRNRSAGGGGAAKRLHAENGLPRAGQRNSGQRDLRIWPGHASFELHFLGHPAQGISRRSKPHDGRPGLSKRPRWRGSTQFFPNYRRRANFALTRAYHALQPTRRRKRTRRLSPLRRRLLAKPRIPRLGCCSPILRPPRVPYTAASEHRSQGHSQAGAWELRTNFALTNLRTLSSPVRKTINTPAPPPISTQPRIGGISAQFSFVQRWL